MGQASQKGHTLAAGVGFYPANRLYLLYNNPRDTLAVSSCIENPGSFSVRISQRKFWIWIFDLSYCIYSRIDYLDCSCRIRTRHSTRTQRNRSSETYGCSDCILSNVSRFCNAIILQWTYELLQELFWHVMSLWKGYIHTIYTSVASSSAHCSCCTLLLHISCLLFQSLSWLW